MTTTSSHRSIWKQATERTGERESLMKGSLLLYAQSFSMQLQTQRRRSCNGLWQIWSNTQKNPREGVIGGGDRKVIEEENLQKTPFLKSGGIGNSKKTPPGHFLLPLQVSEEVVLDGGYRIPKNVAVNFMAAEIGWDPKVWKDPMEFRPERFSGTGSDIEKEVEGAGSHGFASSGVLRRQSGLEFTPRIY